jgi:CHAD domain-containing protein
VVTFHIQEGHDPAIEIRRILLEQIDHGRSSLAGGATEKGVHEARKACKRGRATVALVRGGVARTAARDLDHTFRTAGRAIGPVRDDDVLRSLVASLELQVSLDGPPDREEAAREAVGALTTAEALVRELDLSRVTAGTFATDVARAYAKARRAHRVAEDRRTPDDLHAWRRATKRLLYQLQLLQPMDEHVLGPLADLADGLQEQLGEHHDLSVLHEVDGAAQPVRDELARKAARIEDKVLTGGAWVFAARPATFATWVAEVVSPR